MKRQHMRMFLFLLGVSATTPAICLADNWLVPQEGTMKYVIENLVAPGDTVSVLAASSEYDPFTVTTDDLLIQAVGVEPTIIQDSETYGAVRVQADGLTIRGFTLLGDDGGGGLCMFRDVLETETVVEDCIFTSSGTASNGIVGSRGLTVKGCTFENLGEAIVTDDVGECEYRFGTLSVQDCLFIGGAGINCTCLAIVNVEGSTMDGTSWYGITNLPSTYSSVDRCIFSNCSDDVFASGCPESITRSLFYGNETIGCTITGNLTSNPLYCGEHESPVEEYTLRWDSEAAPGNNQWDALIGARPVECAWGALVRNTTVDTSGTVLVLEDVDSDGHTLTLGPGVSVRFDEDDESEGGLDATLVELGVDARLTVNGTSGSSVTFESAATTPGDGDWRGIVVGSGGGVSVDYATIRHAETGVDYRGTLSSNSISHSTFASNQVYDVLFYHPFTPHTYDLTVQNCSISVGGGTGVEVDGKVGGVTVHQNTITGNSSSTAGIGVGALVDTATTGTTTITSNTISGFTNGSGVYNVVSDSELRNNVISGSMKGVRVTGGTPDIGTTSGSSDNTIQSNTVGISAEGSGIDPVIRNNTISGNTYGVFAYSAAEPNMGTGTSGNNRGLNTFTSNTSYCIYNNNAGVTLDAKGNYFPCDGYGNPGVCWYGNVDTDGAICLPGAGTSVEMGVLSPASGVDGLRASPNPASASSRIRFALAGGQAAVSVQIYDLAGRLVRELDAGILGTGTHEVPWNVRNDSGGLVPNGIYFIRIVANGHLSDTAKMLVLH